MKINLSDFKKIGLSCFFISCFFLKMNAQTTHTVDSTVYDRLTALEELVNYHKSGDDHFMVVGLTTFGFVSSNTTNSLIPGSVKANSLADADHFEFSPMFLWRHGKRFLMEFEPSFSNNGLGVNWADISYYPCPNVMVKMGYFVLPFGTYAKREAAGWINKLPTDPMGVSSMTPTDYGIEVAGGLPMGNMKMSYDVALTNGAQLNGDGTLSSGNIIDNNKNKTITARLGILPFSNSCLELGVSGMFGNVGTPPGPALADQTAKSYAFDLNYVHTFSPVLVNFKAQYNIQDISTANFINPVDSSNYTFNNHTTSGFAQLSLRPTGLNNFLHDFEIAGRYTTYNTPSGSLAGSDQNTVTLALDYWFSWRAVAKIGYEFYNGNSTANQALNPPSLGLTKTNSLFLQFSIQL